MIVGNGDIASVLVDREEVTFFASGVSNSQEDKETEYAREINLLLAQDRLSHLIYFSSLAIFYSDTRYTQHKRAMEVKIKQWFPRYTIMRLGNIDWGSNPHTLINYFRYRLATGEPVNIRDEYRYIVDKKEFLHWVNLIPEWNCEMNITGRRLKIQEIYDEYIVEGKL